jgi:uncharacterized protein (DUF952 family)
MIIYHSTSPEEWAKYENKDFYEAESLYSEGFIHASFAEQLDETLRLYFKDYEKVTILKIDEVSLDAEIRVEKSRNGEFFPHIYGRLNKSAVVNIEERQLNS